jgi:hypothetical protein
MSTRFSVALLLLVVTLAAAEPPVRAVENPWRVRVGCKIVALSPAAATPLLLRLQRADPDERAFAEIDQLVVRGGAELIDWPQTLTAVEQRAMVETIEEFRYPTEFEAPSLPTMFGAKPAPPKKEDRQPWDRWGAITPTSFETRNCGSTLEFHPFAVSPDGALIQLFLVPQSVRLDRMIQFVGAPDALGTIGFAQQPYFVTARTQTSLTIRSGKPILLSSHPQPTEPPRVLLHILTATAARVDGPLSHP